MYYGLVIFPQKSIQDIINGYRKRYDPHYTLIPPHITLKEKFQLDDLALEPAVEKLEEIAKSVDPFILNFHKVGNFYPTSNTIYLAMENSQPLIGLHNKMTQLFKSSESTFDYIPHLTIGQNLSEEELHDVYNSLRMKTYGLETKIDRFHLLYQLENDSWSIYQTFLLNK